MALYFSGKGDEAIAASDGLLASADAVTAGIFLGRTPSPAELKHYRIATVVDLCAEEAGAADDAGQA